MIGKSPRIHRSEIEKLTKKPILKKMTLKKQKILMKQ
jgi:hypothetical protein